MDPRTEPHLLSDTEFWMVEPKLSLTGVSGLESLIGGKHIQVVAGGERDSTTEICCSLKNRLY